MNRLIDLTKELKPYSQDRFLLAVSGGLDSIALLHVFLHFRKHFSFQFSVVHFHHGPSEDENLLKFRWTAFEEVKRQCEEFQVPFFSNANLNSPEDFLHSFANSLDSESEMRKARYDYFEQVLSEAACDHLVLAHHRDDLLETRLLRLIRGTGPEGLQAMDFYSNGRMRPLLSWSREQLHNFVNEKQGRWVDDPTNDDPKYLRNWIRHHWLKDLEERTPGGTASLFRSLDLLVQSNDRPVKLTALLDGNRLIISELFSLDKEVKRQILASYMKSQGLKNYGLSHINEVLKRLDREEKHHTFRLLGRCWKVDAGRMSVEKPS